MKFSIIIPSWNNRKLLEQNLPRVILCGADEVIVADDDSTDGSVEFLKKEFPQVKVVTHRRLGFAGNCNRGVEAVKGEIIVLLNTDVIPQKDFLKPLEKDFADPKVFGVSFNEVNETQFSWTKGKFKEGFLVHESQKKDNQVHQTFWINGGSGAFRKSMWHQLGGFDESFKFYWEDIDLSYRAQKRGWICLWEPQAKVVHEHEATIKKLNQAYLARLKERNQLLFVWKNLTDTKLFLEHLLGLIRRLRRPGYLKIVALALAKLPEILPKRLKELKEKRLSDDEVLSCFS